jgi:hypothetical protein
VLLLPIGITGLWAGVSHVFFPATAAAHIGWQVSPFQFEVGMADFHHRVLQSRRGDRFGVRDGNRGHLDRRRDVLRTRHFDPRRLAGTNVSEPPHAGARPALPTYAGVTQTAVRLPAPGYSGSGMRNSASPPVLLRTRSQWRTSKPRPKPVLKAPPLHSFLYLSAETWLPEPLREGTNPATSAFAGVPLRRERLGERRAPQGYVDDSLLTGLHDARVLRPNIRI